MDPKYNTNELICKTGTDTDIENRYVVAKGMGAKEGMNREFGIIKYKLSYRE